MALLTEGEWRRATTLSISLGGTRGLFERRVSLRGGDNNLIRIGLGDGASVSLVDNGKEVLGGLAAELTLDGEFPCLYLNYSNEGELMLVDVSLANLLCVSGVDELMGAAAMIYSSGSDLSLTLDLFNGRLVADRWDHEDGSFSPVFNEELDNQEKVCFLLNVPDGLELYGEIRLDENDGAVYFLFEEVSGSYRPPYIPWEMGVRLRADTEKFNRIMDSEGAREFLFGNLFVSD